MAGSNKKKAVNYGQTKPSATNGSTIHEWMIQKAKQDQLRFITCGNVGDGKSTLVVRLVWELQEVFGDDFILLKNNTNRKASKGEVIDFAQIVDGLQVERQQGKVKDITYRIFASNKRKFIAADISGHEQYTTSMISSASTAVVAVLLIDAQHGMLTQTRRHAYLLSLLNVRHVILAINKMDRVGYDQKVFDDIVSDFNNLAGSFGFLEITPIPLSALTGENITKRTEHTRWYSGPTLIGCLESVEINRPIHPKAAFSVESVNRPNVNSLELNGTLSSGELIVGDTLRVTASGQTAKLAKIVNANGELSAAVAGEVVTLVLNQEVAASRGDVISLAEHPLDMSDQFEATIVWATNELGLVGRAYELKLANQWASASITYLKYRVDVKTLAHESCKQLTMNDIVVANVSVSKPLVFESYSDNPTLGGFILVDKFTHLTVAAGMIRHNLRRAQNVHRQVLSITREDRERLNGHRGRVIWFTGLSGSGKSTIANALEKELHAQGKRTYILDGDNVRQGMNKDLGFTDADRVENIRRVAEVARLMMDAGIIVMTAFISPFRAEREMARELIGEEHFIEVYVDTPLEVCEQRDPKGLYKKARGGQLPNMTGIDSPYEQPLRPNFTVKCNEIDLNVLIKKLLVSIK